MSTAIRFPSMSGLELEEAKQRMRGAVREYRARLSPRQQHEAAIAFAEHGVQAVAGARCVAVYVSNAHEPSTGPLLEALHARGIRVLLPVLGPRLARAWGDYRGADDLEQRAPGRPPEPSGPALGAEVLAEADAVITPALAIDTHGTRLGQGGGWYDRALLQRNGPTPTFAMVHEAEIIVDRDLPFAEHDVRVDGVITESRWFLLEDAGLRSSDSAGG